MISTVTGDHHTHLQSFFFVRRTLRCILLAAYAGEPGPPWIDLGLPVTLISGFGGGFLGK